MNKHLTPRIGLVVMLGAVVALGAGIFRMSGQASGAGQTAASASPLVLDRSLQEQLRSTSEGKLALTVVAVDTSGIRLRGEFRGARYEQKPTRGADQAQDLAKPFYFTVLPTGEMKSFTFAKGLSIEVRSQLKELATSLQLVKPTGAGEAWRTTEQDASAEYEATYALKNGRIHKKKEQLLKTRVPGGFAPIPQEAKHDLRADADFEVDPSGWPSAVSSKDAFDMTLGGVRMASQSATRAKLTAKESHPELIGATGSEADSEPETAGDAALMARTKASADRSLVDGKSFPQLATGLSAKEETARNQTQARLRALFRTNPGATLEARDAILSGKLGAEENKRIAAALGGADTPEAQSALVSVLKAASLPPVRKMEAEVALAQTKHPTEETVNALKEAMSSQDKLISSTGALAAGAVTKTLHENHGDSQDLVQRLVELLSKSTTDAERALYLKALGNTGDPRVIPALQPFFTGESVELQATAIYALRFIPGDVADQFLLEALETKELLVRNEAVHALANRTLAPVYSAALEALSKTEPEESIRITMLNSLQMRLEQESDAELARAILTWSAASDPSQRVQTFAKEILGEQVKPQKIASTKPKEND